ncbi:DNA polymerase III subunit gamma and tau [Schaalia suimastitidis]|uniref:DNA polymerase III subunit gamma and tau n=1 Tax=Schaalia suimastitidis TaxID=121163 RepID=UPI000401947B|nr:DNA polymerase III subunit gamma and tau [Schaalia suimastitidis]
MTTALYRRYRPDTFAQVIGQIHVTDPLRAALRANRVTHAYLFSGPRGCGKTTSARILARCLNCADGPTDTPCGQCDSCRELATGGPGSLDVVEIDAASHGGVDDARDLRERATFAPVRDRYKIFIIDEAHMVTSQGFNALLKLVEEPPEHVKFVFATTEPERVLGTIRSRTHHYPFRLVPPDVLGPYLTQLCKEEHVAVDDGVIPMVMRAGGGSVRDTLSVLDQLMAGAIDMHVPYDTAVALLGYTDQALLDQSVDALAGGDGAAAYRVVERMVDSGHDPRRFAEDLLQRLRDLLIIAVAGDGAREVLAGTPSDQVERMFVQARNWGPRQLSRAADLVDEALRAMTGATSPRLQLELLIGRILVPAEAWAQGSAVGGTQVPVPGAVGLPGGGAPVEQASPVATGFGARQAREELARRRQAQRTSPTRQDPTAPTSAQSVPAHPSPPVDQAASTLPSPPPIQAPSAAASPLTAPAAAPEVVAPAAVSDSAQDAGQMVGTHQVFTEAEIPATPAKEPEPPLVTAEQQPLPQKTAQGRDADILRSRWAEVVDSIANTSRVVWSMLHQNGQLGAVDAQVAVILLPTPGHVAHFTSGGRSDIVARAIHEVTGLQLQVRAEVGQSGGGRPLTDARATHAPWPEPSHGGEPHPFDEGGHAAQEPQSEGLPDSSHRLVTEADEAAVSGFAAQDTLGAAQVPTQPRGDGNVDQPHEDGRTDQPRGDAHIDQEQTGWPEAAPIPEGHIPAHPGYAPSGDQGDWPTLPRLGHEGPASNHAEEPRIPEPSRLADPDRLRETARIGEPISNVREELTQVPDTAPTNLATPQVDRHYLPGDPAAEWGRLPVKNGRINEAGANAHGPLSDTVGGHNDTPRDVSAASPVVPRDGTIASQKAPHDQTSALPVAPHDQASVPPMVTHLEEPAVWDEVAPDDPGESWTSASPQDQSGAWPAMSQPAAMEVDSKRDATVQADETAPYATVTHISAADDDSASMDDEDAENSGMVGVGAVLEILGGTIIETQPTQGGF